MIGKFLLSNFPIDIFRYKTPVNTLVISSQLPGESDFQYSKQSNITRISYNTTSTCIKNNENGSSSEHFPLQNNYFDLICISYNEYITSNNNELLRVLSANGHIIIYSSASQKTKFIPDDFTFINSIYIHPLSKSKFLVSTDKHFKSFPYSLFQQGIISTLKIYLFRLLNLTKLNTLTCVFRISTYSKSSINQQADSISNKQLSAYIRANRNALIIEHQKSNEDILTKIPLSKSARISMITNADSIEKINLHQNTYINKYLPNQIESNITNGATYFRESVMQGVAGTHFFFNPKKTKFIVENAIEFLIQLNRIKTARKEVDQQCFDQKVGFYIKFFRNKFNIDKNTLSRLESILSDYLLNNTLPLVMSHGDYWLGNIIVSKTNCNLVGIVDWDSYQEDNFPLLDLLHLIVNINKRKGNKHFGILIKELLINFSLKDWKKQSILKYLKELNIETKYLKPLIVVYWLQRCHLWYTIDVTDQDNLNLEEEAWVEKNIHLIINDIINFIEIKE